MDVDAVNEFTFLEASEWLDQENVSYDDLEDLDEMRDLIRSTIERKKCSQNEGRESSGDGKTGDKSEDRNTVCTTNRTTDRNGAIESDKQTKDGLGPRQKQFTTNSQAMMKAILEKDRQMKQELEKIYENLMRFVVSDTVGDEIKKVLTEKYGDYRKTVEGYKKELTSEECPIVVAGETGAGKSSLLNLLLGNDVLPNSLLCTTSTICRLHNSKEKKFVVDNKTVCLMEGDSLSDKLKPYVSVKGEDRTKDWKQVDIYWPIPMIQEPVTIVDTPGIGESDEMTKRLMQYLPNAVAFIYVINSAIAGGVQEDRLLHILNEQRRWENEGKLSTFDQSCAIFVCNKWDQVKETQEEAAVWQDTLAKLKKAWPSLKPQQVFKMDTKKAARYQKNQMGNTELFQRLLNGIEQMVPASLGAKVKRHYSWIEKFIQTLELSITSRINHARATQQEKKDLQEEVMERIAHLKIRAGEVRERLHRAAKERCEDIANRLFTHMHDVDTRSRLSRWNICDIPNVTSDDLEVTRYNADKAIIKRVQDEVLQWETAEQNIKSLSTSLKQQFFEDCRLLHQQCQDIDSILIRQSGNLDFESTLQSSTVTKDEPLFSSREKAILVATSPLWIPLVVTAAFVFLPVGIGMRIKDSIENNKKRKQYEKDKEGFMKKWTEEFLDEKFTHEVVLKFVDDQYFAEFSNIIDKVCNEVIPRQVAADQQLVDNIATDMRSSHEIIKQFLPLQTAVKEHAAELLYFGMKYMIDNCVSMDLIREQKCIGKGSFSDVFLVSWDGPAGFEEAAMKVMRRPLKEHMYAQLTEVNILRNLSHKNVVKLLGVGFKPMETRNGTADSLVLLMEYCDNSLQNIVFHDKDLQCYTFGDKNSRKDAFEFYVSMVTGICAGLAHIHENGYVHRDLKLENVLVKNDIAKICDVGFARHERLMTGTCVGTVTHMAPELYRRKPYNAKADIYSMGILLWELWFAQHAFSEDMYKSYNNLGLLQAVDKGVRPLMKKKFAPYPELADLFVKCWSDDPSERPNAFSISEKLVWIYYQYYDSKCFMELKKCHLKVLQEEIDVGTASCQPTAEDPRSTRGLSKITEESVSSADSSFSVQYTRLSDAPD